MLKTVRKPQLSAPVDLTWDVLTDRFPLSPGERVGQVRAPNRELAQLKAEDHYGRAVVVTRAVRTTTGSGRGC